jgi:hypothetical protein
MNKKVLNIGGVTGLVMVWLSVTITALATNEVTPQAPATSDRSTRTQRQVLAPDQTAVGQIFISEVSPAAAPGKPAWIELAVDAQQIFLPLIARNSSAATSSNSASDETVPPAVASSAHGSFVLTFNGQTYALPAALPPVPPNAFVVVVIGVTGTDDLDFSDGVATLYASNIDTAMFQRGGYAGLVNTAPATPTIDDFVLWREPFGNAITQTELAVAAGVWPSGAVLEFDPGFGGEDTIDVPQVPNQSFGRYAGEWASYRAAHSSRGKRNPPPVPMHTTTPDGSVIDVKSFGLAWTPVRGATAYEFQLATTTTFSNPLVSIVTPHTGWKPGAAWPTGTYYWRVRAIGQQGVRGAYFGPIQTTGLNLAAAVQLQTRLNVSQYRMQRKDTTMLDIGGGKGNQSGSGSPRDHTDTRDRWDGPHVNNDVDQFPTFSWNGYDNLFCVRASVSMMTLYYGGQLSEDRISYFIFEENLEAGSVYKNIPEDDLGFGRGASAGAALEWALNAGADRNDYCPDPPSDAEDEDYVCNSDDPNTAPITITFTTVKNLIDSGRPFISSVPGHARVVDGYQVSNNGQQWVRIFNPVPVGSDDCTSGPIGSPGACSGVYWEEFSSFAKRHKTTRYLQAGEVADPRDDEPSLWKDSDNDGVNDFDEIKRFKTDPYKKDTDGDWVNDKEDIAEYVFDTDDKYKKRLGDLFILGLGPGGYYDAEGDTLRKEIDWDNDGDGIPDGCEDANRDGRYGLPGALPGVVIVTGESKNFDPTDKQPCKPVLYIVNPNQLVPKNVGSVNDPDKLTINLLALLPEPMINKPVYTKNNFTVTIGSKPAPILSVVKSGAYHLLVQPPTQPTPGKYDVSVRWLDPAMPPSFYVSDMESQAVLYEPPPIVNPTTTIRNVMLAIDISKYLSNTAHLAAVQNAARLFADQWSAQDRLGLVTYGTGVALAPVPLAQIGAAGQQITNTKTAIDSLTANGDSAFGSALLLAQNQLNSNGDPNGSLNIAVLSAGQSSIAPYVSSFFNDQTGDLDSIAVLPPGGGCNCAGDTFSRTHIHSFGLGAVNANFMAGLERAADATDGSLGAAGVPTLTSTYLPRTLDNRLANDFKYAAERVRGEQRLLEAFGATTLLNRHTYSVTLDSATSIAFTANFAESGPGALFVIRPDGTTVAAGDAGVVHRSDATHEQLRISTPPTGTWRVQVQSSNFLNSTEYLLVAAANAKTTLVAGDPVFRGGSAFAFTPELLTSLPASAILADNAPILNAAITATVLRSDGTFVTQLQLSDDGVHDDGAANDGAYRAVFTPTLPGAYVIKYMAAGLDNAGRSFERHAQVAFVIPRTATYIYAEPDLPENFTAYRALLAESSIPLVSMPTHAITATQWKKYSLIIIGPDNVLPGESWLTLAARDVITNSKLPIIGLYNGGYALFSDLGLNIGTNVTRTSSMTRTMPFELLYPVWSTPFPLPPVLPYTIYTATAGLSIDLGSFQPGVTFIGLVPSTPRLNLVREDQRFLLWGFARGPADMTLNGRRLFANIVALMLK